MPRVQAAVDPVVGRIVDSGGNIRSRIVGYAKPLKLKMMKSLPWSRAKKNRTLSCPGVMPQDIEDHKLPSEAPFFRRQSQRAKFDLLLEPGVRIERLAFARSDLNCVRDSHLPGKLKHPERFLP